MTIIISILKWLLIILLALLGLVLVLVACLLFVPARYYVFAQQDGLWSMKGNVSWLFHILHFSFEVQKGEMKKKLRIFGIPLLDSEKTKKEKKEKKPKQKKKKKKNGTVQEETPKEELWAPYEADKPEETSEEIPEEAPKPEQTASEAEDSATIEQKPEEKSEGFFEKIKSKIQKIRETISNVIQKITKLMHQKDEVPRILSKPETKQFFSFAWDKLKRLLRHVLPRKVKGYVAYGADNPATTGQVLGIVSVVYAKTGMLLEIRPNFVEKQLECDVEVRGRIQVFTLLVIVLKVLLNKELRKLMKEVKNIKEIE